MFLMSTHPLADGSHEFQADHPAIWEQARALGLTETDYGRGWFVYESRTDYLEALD